MSARIPKAAGLAAVALVALGAAVAQSFGRFAFSALLPAISEDLGLSNTVGGFLLTLNVGAYLLGTLAVAALSSRLRLLQLMRIGFFCSVVGLGLAALAPNAAVLGIAMFAAGFGGALIWIPSPVIAADAIAPEKRRLAIGLMGSGIGLGVVFSGQLSGMMRESLGDAGWRNVYGVLAAIGVVALVLTLLFIGHRQDSLGGNAGIGGFTALRRMNGWLPLTTVYTAFGLMYLLAIGFLTKKLEDDNGWSGTDASLAFTLLGLATVFGGPIVISLAGRFGPRLALTIAFSTWIVVVTALLPGWRIPSLVLAGCLGFLFSGLPSMITLYVVENTTAEDYGPSFAAATLCFGVAQMVSPQIGGVVADMAGSFSPVFLLSAMTAAVGATAALFLPRPAGEGRVRRGSGTAASVFEIILLDPPDPPSATSPSREPAQASGARR